MDAFRKARCPICERAVDFREAHQCSENSKYYCFNHCADDECTSRLNCQEHETCWENHLPKNRKEKENHRPVDPAAQLFVNAVTYSEPDKKKQKILHEQDAVARWFDVDISAREDARLRIYDRFGQLCDPTGTGNKENSNQYPVIVSFIGQTCVGKSTLLRAMRLVGKLGVFERAGTHDTRPERITVAKMAEILSSNIVGPVTRSKNTDDLTRPTSRGVHLYKEDTGRSDRPLLFADCEGFRGGITTTNSEQYVATSRTKARLRSNSPMTTAEQHLRDTETSRRPSFDQLPDPVADVPIKPASYGSSGKSGVELFYARFLYTISNVLVFVTKEDTAISQDLTHLFEWAAYAVFKSVNNPSRKTLIIVRNMASEHDPRLYDKDFLRATYLGSLKNLWEGSPKLHDFVKKYNSQQDSQLRHIRNNNDLFRLFFDTITCSYIPDTRNVAGNPQELFDQYVALAQQINQASQLDQLGRTHSWTNYNVPVLTHIVQRAFDHFRTSDAAFDFYDAARSDNSNPKSPTDHMANFLKHAYSCTNATENIDELISETVSTCLVLKQIRFHQQDIDPEIHPTEVYERDIKNLCSEAYACYVKKYQRCDYKFDKGEACKKRPPSQHSQHVSESGRLHHGSFDVPRYQNGRFRDMIQSDFTRIYESVYRPQISEKTPGDTTYSRSTAIIQKRNNLYRRNREFFASIKSNKTCLACLQAVPDHVLKCEHSYCVRCVKEFGNPSRDFECDWIISGCPLCSVEYPNDWYTIRLKPRCAGVRILTLDGGGIRGIIELALLQAVQDAIGLGANIPIRTFFDLIVGTSTGGIIALALATTHISSRDMGDCFKELSRKTFKPPQPRWTDPFKLVGKVLMALQIKESIYSSENLKRGLTELFEKDANLFSFIQASGLQYPTRVAVTSAKDRNATKCLIASYNRPDLSDCHDFEREDDNANEMKIWEAGLATSAAPFYFPPYRKSSTEKDYVDGALYANCPASVALEEMDKIWADGSASLDVLLSVGTGIQKRNESLPFLLKFGGMEKIIATFFQLLNTEELWKKFVGSVQAKKVKTRLQRLNAFITSDYVSLDEYRKMDDLECMVRLQLENEILGTSVLKTAQSLIASLFFFEPDQDNGRLTSVQSFPRMPQTRELHKLDGTIRCRLKFRSRELFDLLDKVDSFWYAETEPEQEELDGLETIPAHSWEKIDNFESLRAEVKAHRTDFFRLPRTLKTWNRSEVKLILAVRLKEQREKIPISGFPVTMKQLQSRTFLA